MTLKFLKSSPETWKTWKGLKIWRPKKPGLFPGKPEKTWGPWNLKIPGPFIWNIRGNKVCENLENPRNQACFLKKPTKPEGYEIWKIQYDFLCVSVCPLLNYLCFTYLPDFCFLFFVFLSIFHIFSRHSTERIILCIIWSPTILDPAGPDQTPNPDQNYHYYIFLCLL